MNGDAPTFIPRAELPVVTGLLGYPTFLALLENDRNLLELRHDTDTSVRLLQEFCATYDRLKDYSTFCVLLDYDVIAHFASTHPYEESLAGLDALALDIFFIQGRMKYAVPIGAYREFFHHLRHLGLSRAPLPPSTREKRKLDRNAVIRDILSYISETKIDPSESIEDIEAEVRSVTGSAYRDIARLMSIFLDDRFDGVRVVFNAREKEGWKDIQEAHPRKWQRPDPSEVLENDSQNLAIALSDFLAFAKTGKLRHQREGYLLLTRTGAIYNLLSNFGRNEEMRRRAKKHFDCTFSEALRKEFAVVTPQRLALLEWFGSVATPDEAAKSYRFADQYRQKCYAVHEDLISLIDQKGRKQTLDKFYKARETHLVRSFTELFKVAAQARQFEEKRRMMLSLRQSSMRAYGDKARPYPSRTTVSTGSEDEYLEPGVIDVSLGAPSVWEQIQIAIEKKSSPTYRIEFQRDVAPIARFQIFQQPSLRHEILEGEFSFDPTAVAPPTSYIARWNVTTSELELRTGLAEAFQINPGIEKGQTMSNPTMMYPITLSELCCYEGFVLDTDKGIFGAGLSGLVGDWKWLDFAYLGRLLQNIVSSPVRINSVIINIGVCRIHYEAWPVEGDRIMSVASQFNLGPQLAELIYSSTHYLTDRPSLSALLTDFLRAFPVCRTSKDTG